MNFFRRYAVLILLTFAVTTLLAVPLAFMASAQAPGGPAPPPDQTVGSLIALFINTTGTLAVVQLLKNYVIPTITQRYPALLPMLAGAAGPVLAFIQTKLAARLGYPIDLSMVVAIFTGAASVGVNQFVKKSTAATSRIHKLIG